MKPVYNESDLHNLLVLKESKRWMKQEFISADQFKIIAETYKSAFFHPNFLIRILLFVATLIAISGATGLFFLMVADGGEEVISVAGTLYGLATFWGLQKLVIRQNRHYKSGVSEALLYHACCFTVGGVAGLYDFDNLPLTLFLTMVVFLFAAVRYLDLISTVVALGAFAGLVFYECYMAGEIFRQIIPFVFIIVFGILFAVARRMRRRSETGFWENNLLLLESICLLLVYAGGNYLVVRELGVNLMEMEIVPGQDIPFAFVFYALTVIFPLALLYFGIANRDVVLLRVSLIVLAFSVFTFKYYYGFGHPEITLTIGGIVLIGTSIILLRYLKSVRRGFTRENLLEETWGNANIAAFVVSQTMGGNQANVDTKFKGGGGQFGGGGATGEF